ncbi:MAG: FAD-dependent 5-carboxymethylaminomethyl-2-thiouridine(34) oxidoreductase MnmC [Candidatus Accumulibacter sp.]|nr:FAD-dependent 5-carboxymethylaminomethyl-2-thiouridine(34) oxidoreductase MnmC [Accumulibacter sp.]
MTRHAIVIGAGLAGSSAAERLAARGWTIEVVDRAPAAGQGASGNLAGVFRPLPSLDDNRLAQLTRAAFRLAGRHFAVLQAEGWPLRWAQTGVLHLARDDTHARTQRLVVDRQGEVNAGLSFVDRSRASELAGWPVAIGGWWFADGGWVDPSSLCRANLARHGSAVRCRFGCQITGIDYDGQRWRIVDTDGVIVASAPVLIVANAVSARQFAPTRHLPLRSALGQVSHLPAVAGSAPRIVVCRRGYVTPAIDGLRCVGATFVIDADSADQAPTPAGHLENLARLDAILPGFGADLTVATLTGRVGVRPMSSDRLPMIGAVVDTAALDPSRPLPKSTELPRLPGLYLTNGFGARGLVWSTLAGELLACQIAGEHLPLSAELADALDPARFLRRNRRALRPIDTVTR